MHPKKMSKRDEELLEEYEKSLQNKSCWWVILVALGVVSFGVFCSWTVFSMISSALNSFFGG